MNFASFVIGFVIGAGIFGFTLYNFGYWDGFVKGFDSCASIFLDDDEDEEVLLCPERMEEGEEDEQEDSQEADQNEAD